MIKSHHSFQAYGHYVRTLEIDFGHIKIWEVSIIPIIWFSSNSLRGYDSEKFPSEMEAKEYIDNNIKNLIQTGAS